MPSYSINVASVSWVDREGMHQFYSTPINMFAQDSWLRQLCYGMAHTANAEPPQQFDGRGYSSGTTLGRAYRALATFTIGLQTGSDARFVSVRAEQSGVLDPGYTPPFDSGFELYMGAALKELSSGDRSVFGKITAEAKTFSAGSRSSLSTTVLPSNTWQPSGVAPMKCTTISVNTGEVVLGQSIVKFRAGDAGDYLGIVAFDAPNHVPWVWCETVLTYTGRCLALYCSGSAFPSHKFYCNGQAVLAQPFDSNWPKLKEVFTAGMIAHKTYKRLGGIKVGVTGVIPQSSSTEEPSDAAIDAQPYTAPRREGLPKRFEIPLP